MIQWTSQVCNISLSMQQCFPMDCSTSMSNESCCSQGGYLQQHPLSHFLRPTRCGACSPHSVHQPRFFVPPR
jgi:predicted Zn-ribbon and HTH transcriptional regulator